MLIKEQANIKIARRKMKIDISLSDRYSLESIFLNSLLALAILNNLNNLIVLSPLIAPLPYVPSTSPIINSAKLNITMNPSKRLNLSLQYSFTPRPISFIIISAVNIQVHTSFNIFKV